MYILSSNRSQERRDELAATQRQYMMHVRQTKQCTQHRRWCMSSEYKHIHTYVYVVGPLWAPVGSPTALVGPPWALVGPPWGACGHP